MVCAGNGYLHYYKRNFYPLRFLPSIFFAAVIAAPVQAQTHHEFWGRISVTKKMNHQWTASLDFNVRQQSDFTTGNKNNFQLPLMRNTRLWLLYTPGSKYSFVNTFFAAQTVEVKNNELNTATEFLYGTGVIRKDSFKNTILRSRLLAEIKNIQPKTGDNHTVLRYRLQNNLMISFKEISEQSSLSIIFNNELFFKTVYGQTHFDQNRISAMLQWHVYHVEYSIGLQQTVQQQNDYFVRNQLLLYVNVYL
jgi:hypothetical protein